METLVIYFSQKGKTKEAARRIAQLSGADLAEIKTHKSYRMSYRKTVFTALKEILLNERLPLRSADHTPRKPLHRHIQL